MARATLPVHCVSLLSAQRLAIHVLPPNGLDLQHIYRAALSVHWNSDKGCLEDRYEREQSAVQSFDRICEALRAEYGVSLVPAASVVWDTIPDELRQVIERSWQSWV